MRKSFTLCVFLLVFITVGVCSATVTVPGKDGTSLALSQINDIIRHVTGRNSDEQLTFTKDSLLLFKEIGGTGTDTVGAHLYHIDGSGNTNLLKSVSKDFTTSQDIGSNLYWNNIPIIATPIERPENNSDTGTKIKMHALVSPRLSQSNSGLNLSFDKGTSTDVNMSFSSGTSVLNALKTSDMPVDFQTGMTVKSYDHNLIAVAMRSENDGQGHLEIVFTHVSVDAKGVFHMPDSAVDVKWDTYLTSDAVPKISGGKIWFPVSISAGDFDNDGYRNELAVTWSDIDHVYVKVLQLSHSGDPKGGTFTCSEMYSDTVHNYDYSKTAGGRGTGQDLDGVTATYSVSAVTGDFDGDGKDEFAVVFRDNGPEIGNGAGYLRSQLQWGAMTQYGIHVSYHGLIGKIHVVTHKWNGSQFLKDEQTKNNTSTSYHTYEGWSYGGTAFMPVAVKAIKADINGDGRDDVVTLTMGIHWTFVIGEYNSPLIEKRFDNFSLPVLIDGWIYDGGTISPKPFSSSITVDNSNMDTGTKITGDFYSLGNTGLVLVVFQRASVRSVVTGDLIFPFYERFYDIAAGKFTGNFGNATIADDLVLKMPKFDGGLHLDALLLHNIEDGKCDKVTIDTIKPTDDAPDIYNANMSFVPENFLDEGLTFGNPIKITDETDMNYIAVLQTIPYHVDNVKIDSTQNHSPVVLDEGPTGKPQNFTLKSGTEISYVNTATKESKSNMTYSVSKTAETIFAIDNPAVRSTASTFQGVRGLLTTVLGNENKIASSVNAVGKIWDSIKDTTTTTENTTNEHEEKLTFTTSTQAVYDDAVYYTAGTRYMWRYPVLTYPAPDWLSGQTRDTLGSFDKSKVKGQETFITFTMSEPSQPVSSAGIDDFHYQPFHEVGNLFSYPSAISLTEGYEGSTYMQNDSHAEGDEIRWRSSNLEQTITFSQANTDQKSTKKVNKAGPVSKFFSMVDNVFGTSIANIPTDTESSFSRAVTNQESLRIKIPEADTGAKFWLRLKPYIDVAGTTTVAFAVETFDRDSTLWNSEHSIYSQQPDPSLLLPQKFNRKNGVFSGNNTDATALKMQGVRFYVADYDMMSDNLLLKGLKYRIRIPIYNASFVDADNFKVRLSYAKTNTYDAQKTTIGEYTFKKLNGWGSSGGSNRAFAEFFWTPEIPEGVYCLFAEIDPSQDLKQEIHRNRRDVNGDIQDYGGNNMGYYRIGIASSSSPVFDRNKLEQEGVSATIAKDTFVSAAVADSSVFPYIEWVRVNGQDVADFVKNELDGSDETVHAEFEIKYDGEYLMNKVALVGYKLKESSKGKTASEITNEDIERCFVKEHLALFPGEDHKLNVKIDPVHLNDGIGFNLSIHGVDYPLTDVIYGSGSGVSQGVGVSSGGGGGCGSGIGAAALLGVLGVAVVKRKR